MNFPNSEANNQIKSLKKVTILDVEVAITNKQGVLKIVDGIINNNGYSQPYFIITAYSESFLEKEKDGEFRRALASADLVVGDGVSVWAAAEFVSGKKMGPLGDMYRGIEVGKKVMQGKYGDRPEGVELFRELLRNKKYKKFLFGGFNGVAGRLAKIYGCEWSEEDPFIIEKINRAAPDILFVSLGRFKQEAWIARNLAKLETKVVIGVGSAFDEVAGEGVWAKPVPGWVRKMGLKWLWRVSKNPTHLVRAWRAFPVFPLRVYFWFEGKD